MSWTSQIEDRYKQHLEFHNKFERNRDILKYPRFISKDIEHLFLHWLYLSDVHENKSLLTTSVECKDCFYIKDILDWGVMKQLHSIILSYERKFQNSNCSALLMGNITGSQAREILQDIKPIHNEDSKVIGRKRIDQLFQTFFKNVTHQDLLEIKEDSGNYLPYIAHCDAFFKTLCVQYNEILNTNRNENFYFRDAFMLLCFHLGGLFAFPPHVVFFLWAEDFAHSILLLLLKSIKHDVSSKYR